MCQQGGKSLWWWSRYTIVYLIQDAIGGNMSEGFIRDFWDTVKSQSAFPDRNSRPWLYRSSSRTDVLFRPLQYFLEWMSFFGHHMGLPIPKRTTNCPAAHTHRAHCHSRSSKVSFFYDFNNSPICQKRWSTDPTKARAIVKQMDTSLIELPHLLMRKRQ